MSPGSDQSRVIEIDWRDPVAVAAVRGREDGALALLSDGERGRWSYVARAPAAVEAIEADDPRDPFDLFAAMAGPAAPRDPDGPPFQGGAVALFAYEAGARTEPVRLARDPDQPDAVILRYDRLLAFDHHRKRAWSIGGETLPDEAATTAEGVLATAFAPEADPALYEAGVAEVVARVGQGEIFQANLARGWRGRLRADADPLDVFLRLARVSPAPFSAFLRLGGRAWVSNSPELFLTLTGDRVETRPIKGTRPRLADPAADAASAAALIASEKDRAENLMIVDLMRNDLSRVCRPGTVAVERLFELQSFANVHHLVSTVTGRLLPEADAAALLRATFPPGSITGAPKVQAMKVIAELEPPRGVFCGSLAVADAGGDLAASVLIRTGAFVRDGEGWRFRVAAGAGIVADSDPLAERAETEDKAARFRRALTEAQ